MEKQKEFSKMLDLGKEDITNLTENEMANLNGGRLLTLDYCETNDFNCKKTFKTCPSLGTLG